MELTKTMVIFIIIIVIVIIAIIVINIAIIVIIIVIVIIATVGLISSSIFDYMILLRFLWLLLSFTVHSHNLACNSQREACMDCGPFFQQAGGMV